MMATRTVPALGVRMALISALTTWVTLFAWSGFVATVGIYLNPLVGALALVAGVGIAARWGRLAPLLVLAAQLLAVVLYANAVWGSTLLPTAASLRETWGALEVAVNTAKQYAAPVPNDAPSVAPLLVLGGMLCGVLVDFFAATLRRVPVAGLPLLMIYSLPVSALDQGVNWLVFSMSAVGFLGMLALQEGERIGRWGRPLNLEQEGDALGFRRAAGKRHTLALGASATAVAVFLPLLIPTLDLNLLGGGAGGLGGGNDRDVRITNPMTDLRRDLVQGPDVPLVRVRTTQPKPEYLRISMLTVFTGQAWTPGGRDLPARQAAEGDFPVPNGMEDSVPREYFPWDVEITDDFNSLWLPTSEYVSSIDAGDEWRFDSETLDVSAARSGVDTRGMKYSLESLVPDFDAQAMADAGAAPVDIAVKYTELPTDFPDSVAELADSLTSDQPSDYEKAVRLQQWFRNDGGFRYTTTPAPGNGTADLQAFLDGKEGYCEQFATAFAAMARSLDMPSRVVVGFLSGDPVDPDTWEFSTKDLHAWPEVYFKGSGWVKFEPTPSGRAPQVPAYTTDRIGQESQTNLPSNQSSTTVGPSNKPRPTESADAAAAKNGNNGQDGGIPWGRVAWVLALVVVLVALALTPRFVRRTRTARRWSSADPAEAAWSELRAWVLDLGLDWPAGRSPRAAAALLRRQFGAAYTSSTPARPETGAHTNPEAVTALGLIVRALEESRYAPAPTYTPSEEEMRAAVETCVSALRGGVGSRSRLRATWFPASVVNLKHAVAQVPTITRVRSTQDVVDHVG
jgi:transglutaminase-like putative cysteine protease